MEKLSRYNGFSYSKAEELEKNSVSTNWSKLLEHILNKTDLKVYVVKICGWYYPLTIEEIFFTEEEGLEHLGITKEMNEIFKSGDKCVNRDGSGFWYAYIEEISLTQLYHTTIAEKVSKSNEIIVEKIINSIKKGHFEEP